MNDEVRLQKFNDTSLTNPNLNDLLYLPISCSLLVWYHAVASFFKLSVYGKKQVDALPIKSRCFLCKLTP